MTRFIPSDRRQPFLMPPDLRDWVPDDDLVHFIIEAVERVDMKNFAVNHSGSGSAQYDPRMMLALIIYCYANRIFASRKIEQATHLNVCVRFVAVNTHPDHDTICTFRRENFDAIEETFLQVLTIAKEMKILKVGMVSVDGTKIDANANIHKSVRYDRAVELRAQLKLEIAELMKKAESADAADEKDATKLPKEIAHREKLLTKMDAACGRLEAQAKARARAEQAEYEKRKQSHDDRGGGGRPPAPPSETPRPEEQTNLTDPESRIMRKSKRSEYRQSYNAQAAVDADGTQLILGVNVSQCASDANELLPTVAAIPAEIGTPTTVLADTGYANGDPVAELQGQDMEVLVAIPGKNHRRTHDLRPTPPDKPPREIKAPWMKEMRTKLETDAGREKYGKRKQTVEPVFGIIKHAMKFRQFLLRGIDKVRGEWSLVALAYNCRRLHTLVRASAG
jgi:transposase